MTLSSTAFPFCLEGDRVEAGGTEEPRGKGGLLLGLLSWVLKDA